MDQPDAIVFDFDGVIADTETIWFDCVEQLCAEHAAGVTRDALLQYLGDGDVQMMEYVSQRCGLTRTAIVGLLHQSFTERTRKLGMRPGIEALLHYAKKAGMRIGLVSNSSAAYIEGWLTKLGIESEFDCVVTRSDGLPMKPAPDLYLKAVADLGVDPAATLAIEDSRMGLQAALAAGVMAVAYPNSISAMAPTPEGVPCFDIGAEPPERLIREALKNYGR